MPGLASYVAANHFVDALAAHRRSNGQPALSLQLGGWAGSTMVRGARIAMRRLHPDLEPASANPVILDLIDDLASPAVVCVSNWDRSASSSSYASDPAFWPLLRHLQTMPTLRDETAHGAAQPMSVKSIASTLPDMSEEAASPKTGPSTAQIMPLASPPLLPLKSDRSPPAKVSVGLGPQQVLAALCNIVQAVLQLEEPAPTSTPLHVLGWDSLYHAEFIGLVKKQLDLKVPSGLATNEQTLAQIAKTLMHVN